MISIEVVAAWPDGAVRVPLELPAGTTLGQAVAAAAAASEELAEQLDALETQSGDSLAWGVFGQEADAGAVLEAGARLELYRPLQRDPREARRLLASQGLNVTHSG